MRTVPTPSSRAPADLAFTSYLRILAIAGVVMIHVMAALSTNDAVRGSGGWWAANILDSGSSWSVPVFIMVSGALVLAPAPRRTPGEFYRRRLHRIGIPLVVAHVLYFGARALVLNEHLTPGIVVRDMLQVTVAAHLYFFWIIAGLYVIAPLLQAFIAAHSSRDVAWLGIGGMAWMLLVTLSTGALHTIGRGSSPWAPPMLTLFLPYVGYFVLGYALRSAVLRPPWAIVALTGFVLGEAGHILLAAGRIHGVPAVLLSGGYQGVPVAMAAIALFVLARTLIGPGSVLARPTAAVIARRIGDLTLGVFVIHLLVKLAVQRTILADARYGQFLGDALLLYVVVLLVSFALCAVIGRVPVMRRAIGL